MRPHKFNARRTVVDGLAFASKAEAHRFQELKLLAQAGRIAWLRVQPRYPLYAYSTPLGLSRLPVATYVADFEYVEGDQFVTEDVKGYDTAVSRLKRKWFAACYGREVRIVRMSHSPVKPALALGIKRTWQRLIERRRPRLIEQRRRKRA